MQITKKCPESWFTLKPKQSNNIITCEHRLSKHQVISNLSQTEATSLHNNSSEFKHPLFGAPPQVPVPPHTPPPLLRQGSCRPIFYLDRLCGIGTSAAFLISRFPFTKVRGTLCTQPPSASIFHLKVGWLRQEIGPVPPGVPYIDLFVGEDWIVGFTRRRMFRR